MSTPSETISMKIEIKDEVYLSLNWSSHVLPQAECAIEFNVN